MTLVRALLSSVVLVGCTHVSKPDQRNSAVIMREVCAAACPNAVIWSWEKSGDTRFYELVDEGRCRNAVDTQLYTPEGHILPTRDDSERRARKRGLTGHSMICRTIKACDEGDCG